MATVFLDLYGVLADSRKMEVAYNERMADLLRRRLGGDRKRWRELQNASYAWYLEEGARLDALPGPSREGDGWVETVRQLNARQLLWILERAGMPAPPDPAQYAEDLEAETVTGIDALYPDAKPALRALTEAEHRLFLSTNANRANGESALIGGGVREMFAGLVVLETAKAKKDRAAYWRRAFALARVPPAEATVVDDVARYLEPASDMGARCVQVNRGAAAVDTPFPVIRSLAELPDLVGDA